MNGGIGGGMNGGIMGDGLNGGKNGGMGWKHVAPKLVLYNVPEESLLVLCKPWRTKSEGY